MVEDEAVIDLQQQAYETIHCFVQHVNQDRTVMPVAESASGN